MNWVREYNEQLQSGKIASCEEIRTVYARLVQEMDTEGFPYVFSEATGQHAIDFMEKFCRHYQGEHAGELVKLELFQKAFIQNLFGWLERDTGLRRWREYYFEVARKHGKSFLSACIACMAWV